MLQPILVRRLDDAYEIVAGERRWRAAMKAGLQEVPVLIMELTSQEAFEIALVENVQREDLDPLEEAEAYSRLIRRHGLIQDQVAKAVGKSRATIATVCGCSSCRSRSSPCSPRGSSRLATRGRS